MSAQRIDGKQVAADIKAELAVRVAALKQRGIVPGLGTVLVGDDPGSQLYVAGKHRDCAQVGLESLRVDLPGDASAEQISEAIESLNEDPHCTGYIVQLPLPGHIDDNWALEQIDPAKDADGLARRKEVLRRLGEHAQDGDPLDPEQHPLPHAQSVRAPGARIEGVRRRGDGGCRGPCSRWRRGCRRSAGGVLRRGARGG